MGFAERTLNYHLKVKAACDPSGKEFLGLIPRGIGIASSDRLREVDTFAHVRLRRCGREMKAIHAKYRDSTFSAPANQGNSVRRPQ